MNALRVSDYFSVLTLTSVCFHPSDPGLTFPLLIIIHLSLSVRSSPPPYTLLLLSLYQILFLLSTVLLHYLHYALNSLSDPIQTHLADFVFVPPEVPDPLPQSFYTSVHQILIPKHQIPSSLSTNPPPHSHSFSINLRLGPSTRFSHRLSPTLSTVINLHIPHHTIILPPSFSDPPLDLVIESDLIHCFIFLHLLT